MENQNRIAELSCARCGHRERCGATDMLARLRAAGMFRRAENPEHDVLWQLAEQAAPRVACSSCGGIGVAFSFREDDTEVGWLEARVCRSCRVPIPPERLEVIPDARLCAACQEKGAADEEDAEYCPRCGCIMQWRTRHRGVARYVLVCPDCG